MILKLPEFLLSEYLEVRYATIHNIVKFFKVSASRKMMEDIHLQEIVFHNICDKVIEVVLKIFISQIKKKQYYFSERSNF